MKEFEVNTHRNKTRELLLLRQKGTVENYKKKFEQLVYHIKLFDNTMSDTMLVTQFILGLKEEIKAVVEIHMPENVSQAAAYALVQEGILERASSFKRGYQKGGQWKDH